MKNYILKILLKHPRGRTAKENEMIVDYGKSVAFNNESWVQEITYLTRIETLFDKHYQTHG